MLETAIEEQKQKLQSMRDEIFEKFMSRIDPAATAVKDLNADSEISHHYATSHLAIATILIGREREDSKLNALGAALLHRALKEHEDVSAMPDYHHDFNNFAFCLALEFLPVGDLRSEIEKTLLSSSDSQHITVNWLPMRWYVNKWRFDQTGRSVFFDRMKRCAESISQAQNQDGGFEDRLPKGTSFNLQYSTATASLLQFLKVRDCDYDGVSSLVEQGLGFLLSKELPDGDINYQGRGANQIFGWSAWLYLLASGGQFDALGRALDFLAPRISTAQEKNNLLLSDFNGEDRVAWWDYHYESVYYSHCLMWLSLALADWAQSFIDPKSPVTEDTGLSVTRIDDYAIAKFRGRSLYAAERGPSVAAIWHKELGWICKASTGPWFGRFGDRAVASDALIYNHIGFLFVSEPSRSRLRRILQRFIPLVLTEVSVTLQQGFAEFDSVATVGGLRLSFRGGSSPRTLNVPLNANVKNQIQLILEVDGTRVPLIAAHSIKNQYGRCDVFRSPVIVGKEWQLTIERRRS